MTARDFLTNTFNTAFLMPDEIETIVTAMELYAYGQCKAQRELCYDAYLNMPDWEEDSPADRRGRAGRHIQNAKCPIVLQEPA